MPGSSDRSFPAAMRRGNALGQRLDRPRRPSVSAGAKRIAAFDLQQLRHLIEHGRNFGVLDRHRFCP